MGSRPAQASASTENPLWLDICASVLSVISCSTAFKMNTPPNSASLPGPSTPAGWRITRRILVGVAAVVTLAAVFITVENWRGRRAWENCRRALEAKGEVLDWAAYIPAPVPDDQNFYKAPYMQEWFVKGSSAALGLQAPNGPNPFEPAPRKG